MKLFRILLEKQKKIFAKGSKLEKLYPLHEAPETFLFTPGNVTRADVHVRDGIDLKRLMIMVVVALVPCILMALYNTGYQANLAISMGAEPLAGWRTGLINLSGLGFEPSNLMACIVHGALYFFPILIVGFAVGGTIEAIFSIVRGHEINEGFVVTGFLYPLILPPTIPLWQVALGIAFAVILGKEVFGGTGMNILNPALMARAFLFFSYPAYMTGDIWVAAGAAEGTSGATAMAGLALDSAVLPTLNWWDTFIGLVPGSMGETSALCCLLGAALLLITKIGSWRTMAGVVVGTFLMSIFLNSVGSDTNPMFAVPFVWHVVLGGWAFGTVFMATDPVSSAFTDGGKLIYGFLIGVMVVLIRVVNPAYPEGMMLSILFMNMFAPLIDHFFVQANIKRRIRGYGRGE